MVAPAAPGQTTGKIGPKLARVTLYQPSGNAFFGAQKNATVIFGNRLTFKVEKTIGGSPNTCELQITGLNPQSRKFCEVKPLSALVEAGYLELGGPVFIFTGDVRYAISKVEGPDWITTIQLADGDRAYRYARVNRSYKAGASVMTALQECAGSMGLILDPSLQISPDLQSQFASGITITGAARDELTRLLAPFGYVWSIQDGKLQILLDSQVTPNEATVVSRESGMIGSPEYGQPQQAGSPPTLHIKHRIRNFTPGEQVSIQSRDIDSAVFRVDKVTMQGDTFGTDPLVAELDCHPIGSKIKQKKKR